MSKIFKNSVAAMQICCNKERGKKLNDKIIKQENEMKREIEVKETNQGSK